MKNIRLRQVVALIVSALLLICGIIASFSFFYMNVNRSINYQMRSYLIDNAEQNAASTSKFLTSELSTVEGLSKMLTKGEINTSTPEGKTAALKLLTPYVSKKPYKRIGIIGMNGMAITTDKVPLDLGDRDFFRDGINGKSGISKVLIDKNDGEAIHVIYAPIHSISGYPSSVLFATYSTDEYTDLLSMDLIESGCDYFITTSRGDAILSNNGSIDEGINIPEYIQTEFVVPSSANIANMRSQLGNGSTGFFNVKDSSGNRYYVIYTPLRLQQWSCVYILPQDLANTQSDTIARYGLWLILPISILLLSFGVVVTVLFYQGYNELKNTNRHLTLAEERYRILTEQTSNVIFDYNIKKSSIFYSTMFERKFGFVPHADNFPQCALENSWIHTDDKELFLSAFKRCENGRPYLEIEVRLLSSSLKYIWCVLRMTTLFNSENKAYRVVGKIIDIDYTKRKNTLLTERSTCDGLTGLYNKETAKELISNYLNSNNSSLPSCLLLVDIDNFKLVNDRLGHLMGDKCICEIANRMRDTFSQNEVIARVGGDEFIIFIKEVANKAVANELGTKLCQAMSDCHIVDSSGEPYFITASVGVAVTAPDSLPSYESLFKQADTAMYFSKKNGKNKCSDYDSSKDDLLTIAVQDNRDENDELTISEIDDTNDSILTSLGRGSSFEQSVLLFLGEIGQRLLLDHVYIIEGSEKSGYKIAFDWRSSNDENAVDIKTFIPKSLIKDYKQLYDQNGIFHCSNVNVIGENLRDRFFDSNVISTLSIGIFRNNQFVGCLAVDDCSNSRIWSNGDLSNLSLFSKVVDNFILGRKITEKKPKPSDTPIEEADEDEKE